MMVENKIEDLLTGMKVSIMSGVTDSWGLSTVLFSCQLQVPGRPLLCSWQMLTRPLIEEYGSYMGSSVSCNLEG